MIKNTLPKAGTPSRPRASLAPAGTASRTPIASAARQITVRHQAKRIYPPPFDRNVFAPQGDGTDTPVRIEQTRGFPGVKGLPNCWGRDQDLLPAARWTGMDGHNGHGDQADRMFGQRPDHLLAPLAANELGFALLFSHGPVP